VRFGYAEMDIEMKTERLKTGGERTLAGKIALGRKPAKNCRSRVSSIFLLLRTKMRSIYLVGVLFALLSLSGCNQSDMMDKMTPHEDEAIAKNYVKLLRDNQFELIEKDLAPNLKGPNIRETLVSMAALFPVQDPISVKVVGAHVSYVVEAHASPVSTNGSNSSNTDITFEYQFPERWLLASVVTQKKDGGISIIGLKVNTISDSLENLNRFTLSGKSPVHYAILTLAFLLPLFILYVLVLCIRTKIERRKWLWIVFILFGIGQFAMNWTTGQWGLNLLQVQLLGAGAFSPLYGAWTVSVSLPLGAIIFLFWRNRLTKAPIRMTDSGSTADTGE
jgi:hypothetical protein